ncbi:hypothetical protein Tco_0644346 [Tanacetum coccineum]
MLGLGWGGLTQFDSVPWSLYDQGLLLRFRDWNACARDVDDRSDNSPVKGRSRRKRKRNENRIKRKDQIEKEEKQKGVKMVKLKKIKRGGIINFFREVSFNKEGEKREVVERSRGGESGKAKTSGFDCHVKGKRKEEEGKGKHRS